MRSAPNFPPIMMRTRNSPASCFLLALLVVIIIIVIVGQVVLVLVLVLVCVAYLPPSIRNQPLSQSSRP